ncbi:Unknown protein, partial [Striga hermonthica]
CVESIRTRDPKPHSRAREFSLSLLPHSPRDSFLRGHESTPVHLSLQFSQANRKSKPELLKWLIYLRGRQTSSEAAAAGGAMMTTMQMQTLLSSLQSNSSTPKSSIQIGFSLPFDPRSAAEITPTRHPP